MICIRPVSDLRNKFPEIEDIVIREGQPVYLTKNGYNCVFKEQHTEAIIRFCDKCWKKCAGEQFCFDLEKI